MYRKKKPNQKGEIGSLSIDISLTDYSVDSVQSTWS